MAGCLSSLRYAGAFLAAIASSGCVHKGEAELSQNPLTLWAREALTDDAKVLFRQGYAEVVIDGELRGAPLGTGFDASHDACEGFDRDEVPNTLAVVHTDLHEKREVSVEAGWFEVETPADALEIALLDRSVGASAKLQPPADIPLEVGAKFSSSATSLSLARVARRLDLSTRARECIEATLCRPTDDGLLPTSVRYVERIYYGNLLRLKFGEQVFELAAEGTIEGVTAKFEVNSRNVRLDGAVIGRVDPGSEAEDHFDVPQILDHLVDKNLFKIQNELAERSANYEIVAYRFAESQCPG